MQVDRKTPNNTLSHVVRSTRGQIEPTSAPVKTHRNIYSLESKGLDVTCLIGLVTIGVTN